MTEPRNHYTTEEEGDWMVLRQPVQHPDWLDCASRNRTLAGGWKYAMERGGEVALRTELPAGERNGHVARALEWMELDAVPIDDDPSNVAAIREMAAEAGHNLPVEIRAGASGAEMVAAVAKGKHDSPACKRAASLLLLRASGSVAVARGYLHEGEAGFLVRWPHQPAAEEVTGAMDALWLSCQEFGREISVLGDESAAVAYLAVSTHPVSDEQQGDLQYEAACNGR
jgi:hypothetical protein